MVLCTVPALPKGAQVEWQLVYPSLAQGSNWQDHLEGELSMIEEGYGHMTFNSTDTTFVLQPCRRSLWWGGG